MIATRKQFKWKTVLQPIDPNGMPTGQPIEREFRSFWSPARDNITPESIANTAAAMEFTASGKKHRYLGISAQLVTT